MKIAVIGTGYVGLVSGVCFAKIGHQVICVDQDENKISKLQKGLVPIYEPGLKELLGEMKEQKRISFTTDLNFAINESEVIFIAVGTPQNEQDGSADLSAIYKVAEQIGKNLAQYKVIVTKSTVPVGTGKEIRNIIENINPALEFSVVSNPEFLREGAAISDFINPDRVVIGAEDKKAQELMAQIYAPLAEKLVPIIFTDIVSAELIKYAANSFLAIKVSFINEMADLCEKVGGDIRKLSAGIGLDKRIGNKFLNPGPGFGGSCFPKDILALSNIAKQNYTELSLVESAISSNAKRKSRMVNKIISALEGTANGKVIAILGLAFKANTDDIRYSPALTIIAELLKKGATIQAYDQEAMENAKKELGKNSQITFCANAYQAAKDADAVVIATEWEEFAKLDLVKLKNLQKSPVIIDLRNMMEPQSVVDAGFKYVFVGGKV